MSAQWWEEIDVCAMPLGDGRLCEYPGDHGDGCGVYEPCKCSHDRVHHGERGNCWSTACGCSTFRPKVSA